MSPTEELLIQAADATTTKDLHKAEAIYKQILVDNTHQARDQEVALLKLGELYRDQQFVTFVEFVCFNAD